MSAESPNISETRHDARYFRAEGGEIIKDVYIVATDEAGRTYRAYKNSKPTREIEHRLIDFENLQFLAAMRRATHTRDGHFLN